MLLASSCQDADARNEAAARPFPGLTGRVVDGAELIPAAVETQLGKRLEALERDTTDQLVVVTVHDLGTETIEALGLRLGKGWGIGRKDLDNGVLLVVAPAERKARIEVGLGLEGLLTDEIAAQIMKNEMIPRFQAGEMLQGIEAGVSEIIETLKSESVRPMPRALAEAA